MRLGWIYFCLMPVQLVEPAKSVGAHPSGQDLIRHVSVKCWRDFQFCELHEARRKKKSINWQQVKILFTVCFCVPTWCLTFQSRDGIFRVEPSWKTQNNSWKVCWSWRLKVCLWPITVLSCGSKAGSDSSWNFGTFVAPPEIAVVLPNVEKLIIARCSQAIAVHWQNSNVLESKYW